MRDRRKLIVAGALALAVVAAQRPTANVRVITHDLTDPAPHRMEAAVDLGLMAVSVLVTWTAKRLVTPGQG